MGTNALSELFCREQSVGFNDGSFAMHPLWLNRIEPGTFGGQEEGQNAHAFTILPDLLVVLTDPGANGLAFVPGSIIPDQEPVALALGGQALTTPVQELGADRTDGAACDKTQPQLVSHGFAGPSLLATTPRSRPTLWDRGLPLACTARPGGQDAAHPARHACEARRSGSTTPHPENQLPKSAAGYTKQSSGPVRFF